jgi:hypothetical protein
MSLTGQETRSIASLCGERRHPAGSPETIATAGTIPVTGLAKNTAVPADRPCEELRGTKLSKPGTTGTVGTTKIVAWTASCLAGTVGRRCLNPAGSGMQNKEHITVSPMSRQGPYVGRNRPSLRCTVPAGRNVTDCATENPHSVPIGRGRGVRRMFLPIYIVPDGTAQFH